MHLNIYVNTSNVCNTTKTHLSCQSPRFIQNWICMCITTTTTTKKELLIHLIAMPLSLITLLCCLLVYDYEYLWLLLSATTYIFFLLYSFLFSHRMTFAAVVVLFSTTWHIKMKLMMMPCCVNIKICK